MLEDNKVLVFFLLSLVLSTFWHRNEGVFDETSHMLNYFVKNIFLIDFAEQVGYVVQVALNSLGYLFRLLVLRHPIRRVDRALDYRGGLLALNIRTNSQTRKLAARPRPLLSFLLLDGHINELTRVDGMLVFPVDGDTVKAFTHHDDADGL